MNVPPQFLSDCSMESLGCSGIAKVVYRSIVYERIIEWMNISSAQEQARRRGHGLRLVKMNDVSR
jgi:hypothetical protein